MRRDKRLNIRLKFCVTLAVVNDLKPLLSQREQGHSFWHLALSKFHKLQWDLTGVIPYSNRWLLVKANSHTDSAVHLCVCDMTTLGIIQPGVSNYRPPEQLVCGLGFTYRKTSQRYSVVRMTFQNRPWHNSHNRVFFCRLANYYSKEENGIFYFQLFWSARIEPVALDNKATVSPQLPDHRCEHEVYSYVCFTERTTFGNKNITQRSAVLLLQKAFRWHYLHRKLLKVSKCNSMRMDVSEARISRDRSRMK